MDDSFIENLIKNKAQHLAFYFMINGLSEHAKINLDNLNKLFIDNVKKGYNRAYRELQQNYLYAAKSNNMYHFGCIVFYLNNSINKINKFNYGTEGHILDFFNLQHNNDYLVFLKNYLYCFNSSDQKKDDTYFIFNYLSKIGFDIAIYQHIFDMNDTFSLYIKRLSNIFLQAFEQAYEEYSNPQFLTDIHDIYLKENQKTKDTDSRNIKQKKDKETLKMLQQYFNLYKYKNIRINNENIVYYNTVKINFEIPKELYKLDELDLSFQKKLINFLKLNSTVSVSKHYDTVDNIDEYYIYLKSMNFGELHKYDVNSEHHTINIKLKQFIRNLLLGNKILEALENIQGNITEQIIIQAFGKNYTKELIYFIWDNIVGSLTEFKDIHIKYKLSVQKLLSSQLSNKLSVRVSPYKPAINEKPIVHQIKKQRLLGNNPSPNKANPLPQNELDLLPNLDQLKLLIKQNQTEPNEKDDIDRLEEEKEKKINSLSLKKTINFYQSKSIDKLFSELKNENKKYSEDENKINAICLALAFKINSDDQTFLKYKKKLINILKILSNIQIKYDTDIEKKIKKIIKELINKLKIKRKLKNTKKKSRKIHIPDISTSPKQANKLSPNTLDILPNLDSIVSQSEIKPNLAHIPDIQKSLKQANKLSPIPEEKSSSISPVIEDTKITELIRNLNELDLNYINQENKDIIRALFDSIKLLKNKISINNYTNYDTKVIFDNLSDFLDKIELLLSQNLSRDAQQYIDYLLKNFNKLFKKFSKDRNDLSEYSLRYEKIKKLFKEYSKVVNRL
jgi:hypothetical protein